MKPLGAIFLWVRSASRKFTACAEFKYINNVIENLFTTAPIAYQSPVSSHNIMFMKDV